jgi:tetratricopeptide (TPR) repeat protein
VGIGLMIVIAMIIIGGLGVAWRSSRRSADPMALGSSAYAEGDWSRAADLARRRLKTVPGDLEALRLLARSTARLGRDGQANAMFARMGSEALEAEDLLLLGKGLDRAGRKEEAGRVWEKALRLRPDHAETLEQLVIRDTAQNRLAEAAERAERLARQPGWELRGELNLGALRAELDDPAGAAEILRRALERPEAARLDRPVSVQYRNLLARSLLRTGRTGEARDILRSVLDRGANPQASWLLSRAALLEGRIPEASAALAAAGSYRAEHPLEAEPGPFVGEARCADCHPDVFRAARASRHTTTLLRGKPLLALPYPAGPIADPDDPSVSHVFRVEDGTVRFETHTKDKSLFPTSGPGASGGRQPPVSSPNGQGADAPRSPTGTDSRVLRAVVDYAFGSADRYVSLVGRDDGGRPYVLRLSHYQTGQDAGWVRTTGHTADAEKGQDILGKPLDVLDGVQKCLFCHTTNPRAVLDGSGPESHDRAIGCERCHGPGALHEKAVTAKFADLAIIRPSEATAEGRTRLCGQCHSFHQELPLARTDPFWIRFQGTTLPWSRCYTESGGSFDCMTCHDPHHDADRSEDRYNRLCLDCHSGGPKAASSGAAHHKDRSGRRSVCPVNATNDCVGCHMPPFRSAALHATFTDHFIRVHPGRK